MGRNQRRTKPLGFGIGELWGNALELDPSDTKAGRAVAHCYTTGGRDGAWGEEVDAEYRET